MKVVPLSIESVLICASRLLACYFFHAAGARVLIRRQKRGGERDIYIEREKGRGAGKDEEVGGGNESENKYMPSSRHGSEKSQKTHSRNFKKEDEREDHASPSTEQVNFIKEGFAR